MSGVGFRNLFLCSWCVRTGLSPAGRPPRCVCEMSKLTRLENSALNTYIACIFLMTSVSAGLLAPKPPPPVDAPDPQHTCSSLGSPSSRDFLCTTGFPRGFQPLQKEFVLVNAISCEKEIITGGSYLKLRVCGLKQLGKWLPLCRKLDLFC